MLALAAVVAGGQYINSTVPPCIAQLPQPSVHPGPPIVELYGQYGTDVAVPFMVVDDQSMIGTPFDWSALPSFL
jgi:hypothetical protein